MYDFINILLDIDEMREPKLQLLMMIMKCLVLGCVIDNKGDGMRILNVNNGNHDCSTDTPSGYTFWHQISQLSPRTTFNWKISHKLTPPTPTLGTNYSVSENIRWSSPHHRLDWDCIWWEQETAVNWDGISGNAAHWWCPAWLVTKCPVIGWEQLQLGYTLQH